MSSNNNKRPRLRFNWRGEYNKCIAMNKAAIALHSHGNIMHSFVNRHKSVLIVLYELVGHIMKADKTNK